MNVLDLDSDSVDRRRGIGSFFSEKGQKIRKKLFLVKFKIFTYFPLAHQSTTDNQTKTKASLITITTTTNIYERSHPHSRLHLSK